MFLYKKITANEEQDLFHGTSIIKTHKKDSYRLRSPRGSVLDSEIVSPQSECTLGEYFEPIKEKFYYDEFF
jgi:hypothetical protein